MKQKIILIAILITLFVFGLLIYDFSDELDNSVTNHNWYAYSGDDLTVVNFKDNKFLYYYEKDNQTVSEYDTCTTYRFNRSINVIKLKCDIGINKLYISSIDDKQITVTIEGSEKVFYANEKFAENAKFIADNNMSETEFTELMTINTEIFTKIAFKELISQQKSKTITKVAFINSIETYQNALNIKTLTKMLENNENLVIIDINDITAEELVKLNKINNKIPKTIDKFDLDSINIYEVGNKKIKYFSIIKIEKFSDLQNNNNI